MPVAVISAAMIETAFSHAEQVASRMDTPGAVIRAMADDSSVREPANRLESMERAAATCRFWEEEVAAASLRGEIVLVARREPPTGGPSWPEVERNLYRIASGAAPAVAEIKVGEDADPAASAAAIRGAIARRGKMNSRPLAAGAAKKGAVRP